MAALLSAAKCRKPNLGRTLQPGSGKADVFGGDLGKRGIDHIFEVGLPSALNPKP